MINLFKLWNIPFWNIKEIFNRSVEKKAWVILNWTFYSGNMSILYIIYISISTLNCHCNNDVVMVYGVDHIVWAAQYSVSECWSVLTPEWPVCSVSHWPVRVTRSSPSVLIPGPVVSGQTHPIPGPALPSLTEYYAGHSADQIKQLTMSWFS